MNWSGKKILPACALAMTIGFGLCYGRLRQSAFTRAVVVTDSATAPFQSRLDNGLSITFVERRSVPAVWAMMVFDGVDPGEQGLASTCLRAMADGPSSLDRDAYVERLRSSGIGIEFAADGRYHAAYLTTVSAGFADGLALFAATLRTPGFRTSDLGHALAVEKMAVGQQSQPTARGEWIAIAAALGDAILSRRTTPPDAIGPDDCRRWAARSFGPRGARLIVVGDTDAPTLMKYVQAQFANWVGPLASEFRERAASERPEPPSQNPLGYVFFVESPEPTTLVIATYRSAPVESGPTGIAARLIGLELGGHLRGRTAALAYALRSKVHQERSADVQHNAVVVDGANTGAALQAMERAFHDVRVAPLGSFLQPSLKDGLLADVLDPLDTGAGLRDFFVRWPTSAVAGPAFATLPTLIQTVDTAAVGAALRDLAVDKVIYVAVGNRAAALPHLQRFAQGRAFGEVRSVSADGVIEAAASTPAERPVRSARAPTLRPGEPQH